MIAAAGIILLLIALTGFYVAAEFGAVGVRRSRLRRLCEDGDPTAARLLPIVENPPLARGLYAAAEVGQEIPTEFYRAVAEVLAYIYRLMGRKRIV